MFFFTCLLLFCPTKEQTKAGDGIDLINCKCLAPLFLQLSLFVGRGMFIKVPDKNGLHETMFNFNASAVYNNEPNS
jgi:hypothetical protein